MVLIFMELEVEFDPQSKEDKGDKENHLLAGLLSLRVVDNVIESCSLNYPSLTLEKLGKLKNLWLQNLVKANYLPLKGSISNDMVQNPPDTVEMSPERPLSWRRLAKPPQIDYKFRHICHPAKQIAVENAVPSRIVSNSTQNPVSLTLAYSGVNAVEKIVVKSKNVTYSEGITAIPWKKRKPLAPVSNANDSYFPPYGAFVDVNMELLPTNFARYNNMISISDAKETGGGEWLTGRVSQLVPVGRTGNSTPCIKIRLVSKKNRGEVMIPWPNACVRVHDSPLASQHPPAASAEAGAEAGIEEFNEEESENDIDNDMLASGLWLLENLEEGNQQQPAGAMTAGTVTAGTLDFARSTLGLESSTIDNDAAVEEEQENDEEDEVANDMVASTTATLAAAVAQAGEQEALDSFDVLSRRIDTREIDSYFGRMSSKRPRILLSDDRMNTRTSATGVDDARDDDDSRIDSEAEDGVSATIIAMCRMERRTDKVWQFHLKSAYVHMPSNRFTEGDIIVGSSVASLNPKHFRQDSNVNPRFRFKYLDSD